VGLWTCLTSRYSVLKVLKHEAGGLKCSTTGRGRHATVHIKRF
jgi:hypothetical protein